MDVSETCLFLQLEGLFSGDLTLNSRVREKETGREAATVKREARSGLCAD